MDKQAVSYLAVSTYYTCIYILYILTYNLIGKHSVRVFDDSYKSVINVFTL